MHSKNYDYNNHNNTNNKLTHLLRIMRKLNELNKSKVSHNLTFWKKNKIIYFL